jgi:phage gp36-like protein
MYCTLADIQAVIPEQDLVELTDDSLPPAVVDQIKVNRAISDAGELIDGSLRGRYSLPLSPAPGLINTLAVDLAIYRLYSRRIRLTPPEVVGERHKEALKLLEQIRNGRVSLGAENVGGAPTPDAGGPQISVPDRVFSRDTLEDY